jgi:hypothetical protein
MAGNGQTEMTAIVTLRRAHITSARMPGNAPPRTSCRLRQRGHSSPIWLAQRSSPPQHSTQRQSRSDQHDRGRVVFFSLLCVGLYSILEAQSCFSLPGVNSLLRLGAQERRSRFASDVEELIGCLLDDC